MSGFVFKKLPDAQSEYGTVEVLAFNYDGKGSALAIANGRVAPLSLSELDNFVGERWRTHYLDGKEDVEAIRQFNAKLSQQPPVNQNIGKIW